MTDSVLDIKEFLQLAQRLPVIDVRTPAEYSHAHIPGAVNLPLFTNEERSVIGTLYLKKGSAEAMIKGLEFIGPKMKSFVETAAEIAPNHEALMHCWRGGMRSSSMAWLMNQVGIRTLTLTGGYKSYRRYTAECFGNNINLVVIGGMTGSGKTAVLKALQQKGIQVIDLEKLACHKGSVFGGIGEPEQPSVEQFENNLFSELVKLDTQQPVFVEDESIAIGKVFLPRKFYDQMSIAHYIRLDVRFEDRLTCLVNAYAKGTNEELITGVKKIEKRLGMENASRAITMITEGDLYTAAEIVLKYYDKIYSRSMNRHNRKSLYPLQITGESPDEIADMIISKFDKWR